jgi:serine/threonine-protein kinase
MYTLLTGRTPFEGETILDLLHKHRFAQFERPRELVPEVPHELDDVLCQLLDKDPGRRPADGHVLFRQLDSIRRKYERTAHFTVAGIRLDATQAYNSPAAFNPSAEPGPATLMSQLMRQELERQNRGGPVTRFINQPWVLLVLFVLSIGLIAWGIWRPRAGSAGEDSSAEQATANEDGALHVALLRARKVHAMSEAERFYRDGLRLCRDGDLPGARRVWGDLSRGFRGVESEQRWVELAEKGLAELDKRKPDDDQRWGPVRASVEHARQLRDQGKKTDAETIWEAIEDLYRDDPSARPILDQIRKDRAK